jgi:hypothetical protein
MNEFQEIFANLAGRLVSFGATVNEPPHQMKELKDDPQWTTIELRNVVLEYPIPHDPVSLQVGIRPSLPWAEDHFQERVSGQPLNPPPSAATWPYAQRGNEEHMTGGKFSHTYPERMWPKHAMGSHHRHGIRFYYGDLDDLVQLLAEHPYTRQAYLPVWFPEDLTAANKGERVPCTLGYHFMLRGGELNMTYFIRSCDLIRYLMDDVYMACRLVQWVWEKLGGDLWVKGSHPGTLTMHIVSLHCFAGDLPVLDPDGYYADVKHAYDDGYDWS